MAHQKHVKLTKPTGGKFGRNEIGIIGAPCSEIKKLVAEVLDAIGDQYKIAYLDADHNAPEQNEWSALQHNAFAQLTNKISHYALEVRDEYQHYFNEADLVLINGNHHQAAKQIAWVHPKKSLENKLDKLTDVGMVILDNDQEIPTFLSEHLAEKEFMLIRRTEEQKIINYIEQALLENRPSLNGLVLVGGKSTRMQRDKSQLVFHGEQPQFAYLNGLLENFCEKVYISARDEEQAEAIGFPAIIDKFIGLGPYGGILSALMENPNAAWLVVAVDLPFLDEKTIGQLVKERSLSKTATCFIDRHEEWPEPLITIWEPRAYPILLNFLANGYSCPRKALINSDVKIITERDVKALTNVNHPEDYEKAVRELHET